MQLRTHNTSKNEIYLIVLKNPYLSQTEQTFTSTTQTSKLTLFRKAIEDYIQNHNKQIFDVARTLRFQMLHQCVHSSHAARL